MRTNHCLLLTAVAAVLLTATSANHTRTDTAYNMLEKYDFPPGIIPQGVQSYDLRQDGSLEVHFLGECALHVSGFKIRYRSRLAGTIQNDMISGIEDVKVKIVFFWVRIWKVSRDSDEIRVHVGAISKSFPVGDFSFSPQCK